MPPETGGTAARMQKETQETRPSAGHSTHTARSLAFDYPRLARRSSQHREVSSTSGVNFSAAMKQSGSSGETGRHTRELNRVLEKILDAAGEKDLWIAFLALSPGVRLEISERFGTIYDSPQAASKDGYKRAINSLREWVKSNQKKGI